MIDVDAMAKAIGGDGCVRIETSHQRGVVHVVDGKVYSALTLKQAIGAKVIEAAMMPVIGREVAETVETRYHAYPVITHKD